MANVHIRVDDKLKRDVQKVLKRIGFDVSGAVKLYFQQIILSERIPFTPSARPERFLPDCPDCDLCRKYRLRPGRTVNGWKPETEERLLREADNDLEVALRKGELYTPEELFAKWNTEDGRRS